jgi:hypothetical protein
VTESSSIRGELSSQTLIDKRAIRDMDRHWNIRVCVTFGMF